MSVEAKLHQPEEFNKSIFIDAKKSKIISHVMPD